MSSPCERAWEAEPCSDSTEARRLDTAASTAAEPTASRQAFHCARLGASRATRTMPTAAAASAPREKLRYTPSPTGAAATTAAMRTAGGRPWSPPMRANRTRPMAASAPIAFQ